MSKEPWEAEFFDAPWRLIPYSTVGSDPEQGLAFYVGPAELPSRYGVKRSVIHVRDGRATVDWGYKAPYGLNEYIATRIVNSVNAGTKDRDAEIAHLKERERVLIEGNAIRDIRNQALTERAEAAEAALAKATWMLKQIVAGHTPCTLKFCVARDLANIADAALAEIRALVGAKDKT